MSRHMKWNLWLPIIMVVVVLMIGLRQITVHPITGYILCFADLIYLIISIIHYEYMEKLISGEMLSAGFEQSQVQKNLLKELPIPYVLTDREGMIIWFNRSFQEMAGEKAGKKNITQIFSSLYKKVFPQKGTSKDFCITLGESKYRVECRSVVLNGLESAAEESGQPGQEESGDVMLAFYFFDETQLIEYREESRKKSLVAGLIYIDNYEEVLENMEEVRQSLLLALVERKIVKYMQGLDAIIKKFEKDKFLFVFEEQNLEKLMESKFSILDDVRMINIGNELSMTLSISVGVNAPTYIENYESARIAMDLALGRGGDQAVVRDGDSISYYGGKTKQVEKSTRVRARVKAHALRQVIEGKEQVAIMGHKISDLDSFGAAIGVYRAARSLNKKAFIVINDITTSVRPVIDHFMDNPEYDSDMFVTSETARGIVNMNTAMVVVDVNTSVRTEGPELLNLTKTIVVIDHHRQSGNSIENPVLSYIEPYASSACEMVAEILQYITDSVKLRPEEADAMYAGLMIDTNNFISKTGVRTFEAAAFLKKSGADITRVRLKLRDDMQTYKARAEAVKNASVEGAYAYAECPSEGLESPTVVGAQVANELLNITGVEASFVFTVVKGVIYVSARSYDSMNVQLVMERLGGGGHSTMAGTQLKDMTVEEAEAKVKSVIKSMKMEGEI